MYKGENFGLVGESGSGKTTTGKYCIRLIEPTSGKIKWKDQYIEKKKGRAFRELRLKMQMIFQNPYSSLDNLFTAQRTINEALEIRGIKSKKAQRKEVEKFLTMVGLPLNFKNKFPHELSGGEKQRVGIARALAANPELIVADEPVAALDASVKTKTLQLLLDLQKELNLTMMYISHDLSVVKHVCDRIAVMYAGEIVELGKTKTIFEKPVNPYTEALISSVPIPNPETNRKRIILKGDIPSQMDPPPGCSFHTRCLYAEEICKKKEPKLIDIGGGHLVACHLRT